MDIIRSSAKLLNLSVQNGEFVLLGDKKALKKGNSLVDVLVSNQHLIIQHEKVVIQKQQQQEKLKTKTVIIPKEFTGLVIGAKGVNIKELEN